jgi:hypothetical protein
MSKNVIFLVIAALVMAVVSGLLLKQNLSSPAGIGYVVGSTAATIGFAVILAAIPAGIYWLFKRKRMPGFNGTIWVLWFLVSSLSLVDNIL